MHWHDEGQAHGGVAHKSTIMAEGIEKRAEENMDDKEMHVAKKNSASVIWKYFRCYHGDYEANL